VPESTLQSGFKSFWAARTMRERRILGAGAAALLLLLLYLIFIAPALGGVARLQHLLPQTRQRAAQLDALLTEAKSLRKLPVAASPAGPEPRAAVEKSLEAAGLKATHSEALPNGDLRLSFTKVPYGKWAVWLAAGERSLGVHTVAAKVKASGPDAAEAAGAGNVDIELTLHPLRAG